MLHPHTELRRINQGLGYGVVATRLIPRGTIIWVLDKLDQTFTRYQIAHIGKPYSELLDEWSYKLPNGDSVLNWDLARYFNHSCDPSCMNAGMTFEIAVRDIPPGAELTDDYRMLNKSLPCECACGSVQCHRRINADDFLHHAPRWDNIIQAAFPSIADVEQPLWNIVREKDEIAQALAEPHRIPSCRTNHFFSLGKSVDPATAKHRRP
jgi:uncharacterized protein